jgi:large subunit ribosomal protein L4
VKSLARKSALSYKVRESALTVVEDFNFATPKTKEFIALTKNLKVDGKKTLFVSAENNTNVYLSARNVQRNTVINVSELNTYKVMDAAHLILSESAVAAINNF